MIRGVRDLMILIRDPATVDLIDLGLGILKTLKKQGRLTPANVQVVKDGIEPVQKLAKSGVPAQDIMDAMACLEQLLQQPDGLAKLQGLTRGPET